MRCARLLAVLFIVSIGACKMALGAESDDPILGRWRWFTDDTKTFNSDGSVTKDGTWRCVNPGGVPRKYVVVWSEGKFVDIMVLGNDGNHLSGWNDVGVQVSAERLSRGERDKPIVASRAGSIRAEMVTAWKAENAAGQAEAAGKNAPPVQVPTIKPPGSPDDIFGAMFERYPASHILVDNGVDIYISDEGIYVIQRKWVDPGNGENAALWANWNCAVTADGVFEWQTGQKKGIKIARNDQEILGYLFSNISATWGIIIYNHYLMEPDKFNVVPGKGGKWKELQSKKIEDGGTIYLTEKPLWFYGTRTKTPGGGTEEHLVSAPEQIEKIPDVVKARLRAIHFEDSPLSLARHVTWP